MQLLQGPRHTAPRHAEPRRSRHHISSSAEHQNCSTLCGWDFQTPGNAVMDPSGSLEQHAGQAQPGLAQRGVAWRGDCS